MEHSRRSFISFLGKASLSTLLLIPPFLMSCGNTPTPILTGEGITEATIERLKKVLLKSINPSEI